ncbi:MAG: ATPase, partial [Lachnospiraceae bacterium]|nr:ATPase [Lachnospiraceae bacterium]
MNYFAGLDIGGTHGRLKCCAVDGTELGTFQSDGCSINTDGPEKSRLRCRKLVLPALQSMGLSPDECDGICVAASGIDSPSLEKSIRDTFEEMGFRPEILYVMNDCEIFLHMSDGISLALISGTGSICF